MEASGFDLDPDLDRSPRPSQAREHELSTASSQTAKAVWKADDMHEHMIPETTAKFGLQGCTLLQSFHERKRMANVASNWQSLDQRLSALKRRHHNHLPAQLFQPSDWPNVQSALAPPDDCEPIHKVLANELLTDKYQLDKMHQACDQQTNLQLLSAWLEKWKEHEQSEDRPCLAVPHAIESASEDDWVQESGQSFSGDSDEEHGQKSTALLLSGPVGCGKTALVYAAARDANLHVIEVNAGSECTSSTLAAYVGEAMQSSHLSGQLGRQLAKQFSSGMPMNSQCLILFEGVDSMAAMEPSLSRSIAKLVTSSRRPVVMTCNDVGLLAPMLRSHAQHIDVLPPSATAMLDYLMLIAACEGICTTMQRLDKIVQSCGSDLRHALLTVQVWADAPNFRGADVQQPALLPEMDLVGTRIAALTSSEQDQAGAGHSPGKFNGSAVQSWPSWYDLLSALDMLACKSSGQCLFQYKYDLQCWHADQVSKTNPLPQFRVDQPCCNPLEAYDRAQAATFPERRCKQSLWTLVQGQRTASSLNKFAGMHSRSEVFSWLITMAKASQPIQSSGVSKRRRLCKSLHPLCNIFDMSHEDVQKLANF